MYVRFKLQLTQRMKRELEVIEKKQIENALDSSPLELKPGIWGISLDLPKFWQLLKKKYGTDDRQDSN